jgi:ELWxxDGT repeat protein
VLVKDIWPGPSSGGPGVGGGSQFVSLNDGTLIFPAFHPDTGHELWKSDGTEAGTMLVRDINPGRANSSPEFPINVAGTIFFGAFRPDIGVELWKSDGTEAGTALVKDINPGPGHSRPALVASVNAMAVFSAFEPDTGHEFWRSDGTEAGTTVIHEIVLGRARHSWVAYSTPTCA